MKKTLFGLVASSCFISPSHAEIIYFDLPDRGVISPQDFINKKSDIKIGVSAGLDRKTEIIVKEKNAGFVIYDEKSDYITVKDRISNSLGNDFYGQVYSLPTLSDNTRYEIIQNVYDIDGMLVKSEGLDMYIDLSGPEIGEYKALYSSKKYNDPKWTYNGEQTLPVRETLSIENSFDITGAPIKNASYIVYEKENGKWEEFGSYEAVISGTSAIFQRPNYTMLLNGLQGLFPHYSSEVKVKLSIEDEAGNIVDKEKEYQWITCDFGKDKPLSAYRDTFQQPIGILDPTSNGIPGIPNTQGFRAFTPGDVIPTNPTSVILRIPIDVSRVKNSLYGYDITYGNFDTQTTPLAVDDQYAYYKTVSKIATDTGALTGIRVYAGSLCTGYINIGNNFSEDARPATIYGATITFDDKSFELGSELNSYQSSLRSSLPKGDYYNEMVGNPSNWSELKSLNVRVKPQAYNQRVVSAFGSSSCTVPSGQDNCTITYNTQLEDLDGKIIHTNYGIQSYKEGTSLFGSYTVIFKFDSTPPKFESTSLDEVNKIVTGKVWNHDGFNPYGDFRIAAVVASATNKATGETTIINSDVEQIQSPYFIFKANLASLPDGEYVISAIAYDSAGNKADQTVGELKSDNTPPAIGVINQKDKLENFDIVKGLESLSILLTDASKSHITSVEMTGGPAKDKVKLDWIEQEQNKFTLEYPRLFPVSEREDSYNLTIEAEDEYLNKSLKTVVIQYIPANVVELEDGVLLTSNKLLLTRNDSPLYQITTSSLRGNDGQLLSGSTPVSFTLRSDSDFSVNIMGKKVEPGETYSWDYDLTGTGGKVIVPVLPYENNKSGVSNFMFEIMNVVVAD